MAMCSRSSSSASATMMRSIEHYDAGDKQACEVEVSRGSFAVCGRRDHSATCGAGIGLRSRLPCETWSHIRDCGTMHARMCTPGVPTDARREHRDFQRGL